MHESCANPNCPDERGQSPRCEACRHYWYRHGVERPAALCQRLPATGVCQNPACAMPTGARTYCRACAMYRSRHPGAERPAALAHPQPRRCAIEGCTNWAPRRLLCQTHHMRAWRERRAAQERTA